MRLLSYRVFLALTTLEGIITVILLLVAPSETKSAVLLGYSVQKIILVGLIFIIDLFGALVTIRAIKSRTWLEGKIKEIGIFLETGGNLFYSSFFLLLGIVGFCSLLIIGKVTTGGTLFFAINRAWYALTWFTIILLQTAILLGILYHRIYIQKAWGYKLILIVALISANLFQWVVLIYKLDVYTKIYDWFWKFPPVKYFNTRDMLVVVMLSGSCLLAWYLLRKPDRMWKPVLLLILWGTFLQFGFGMIDGTLPDSILHKYSDTSHVAYVEEAAKNPDLLNAVRNYEELYGKSSFYTGTKPPGLMVFYVTVEKIANIIHPLSTSAARFGYLLRFIGFVFPVLSFLVILPLYALGCRLGGEVLAVVACLFYLVFPNVMLIPLFLDQVLYPFLLSVSLLSLVIAIQKSSFWWALITGVILFLSIFFTFSMLPVLFMAFLMIGLHFLLWGKDAKLTKTNRQALLEYALLFAGLTVGIGVAWFLFRAVFQYDPIFRYTHAIELHYQLKGGHTFTVSLQSLSSLPNLLLGANADFTFWTGYAPVILFLIAVGMAVKNVIEGRATKMDWITSSFLVTFLFLNLSGQTGNETGRLWIFLTPVLALVSADQAVYLFPHKKNGIYLVLLLQLLTTYLIFHFNDFRT